MSATGLLNWMSKPHEIDLNKIDTVVGSTIYLGSEVEDGFTLHSSEYKQYELRKVKETGKFQVVFLNLPAFEPSSGKIAEVTETIIERDLPLDAGIRSLRRHTDALAQEHSEQRSTYCEHPELKVIEQKLQPARKSGSILGL